ncbi:MAG: GspE/PulE family protein, partial [Phycisphaerae bacterium]|nr:GspE/PulE family protein [Phycisphaerae bacterium]
MEELSQFLLDEKILKPEQLEAVGVDDDSSEPVYYRLLRKYPHLESKIWEGLAQFLQVDLLDPYRIELDGSLVRLISVRMAHEYSIVPLRYSNQLLEIALADPRQFEKCEEFALLISSQEGVDGLISSELSVMAHLARPGDIAGLTKSLYGIGAETVHDMLEEGGVRDDEVAILDSEVSDLSDEDTDGEEAAIVRFVNKLLLEAVKIGASDIHLEPFERELRIRYRLDGMLRTEPVPERIKHLEAAIISRIKIMANLDIAEKRLPQDGQIRLRVLDRPIDVRVSILPTMFGQGLALRLLDRMTAFIQMEKLGITKNYLGLFRHSLSLSHGVILVTGPTGSGKTTTLYAALNELDRENQKVITVEDPIEYQLENVSQIQVKPSIDLSFANVLRSILRHDPDVIMIGEIRDSETARISISAAMTGHLVFSTLHTNDAPSAPVRLLEMGVEPYLVASALEVVLAQRLIRVLCPLCKRPIEREDLLPWKGQDLRADGTIFERGGCAACRDTG